MDERKIAAMHALSAMRLYHPVFPDDTLPFAAIAEAMRLGDLGDAVLTFDHFVEFEKPLRERLRDIDTLVQQRNLTRGWLCAAAEALHLVVLALSDYPSPDDADRIRRAAFAMVDNMGFSFL